MSDKKEICMLARKWEAHIDPGGWWMSEKFNGIRMVRPRGNLDLFSREGNPFNPPQWWRDQLPRGIFLDGEAFVGYGKFELTQSILLRKTASDDAWKQVTFQCIEPVQKPGTKLAGANAVFRPIHQTVCSNREHLQAFFDSVIAAGGEGVVLRHPMQAYHAGRSPYLLKVKPEIKGAALVWGYERDSMNRITSLKCHWWHDGKNVVGHESITFSISNGLTEEMRLRPPPTLEKINFIYQCLSANGTPMMARLAKEGK